MSIDVDAKRLIDSIIINDASEYTNPVDKYYAVLYAI